jgi:hypothetical protein
MTPCNQLCSFGWLEYLANGCSKGWPTRSAAFVSAQRSPAWPTRAPASQNIAITADCASGCESGQRNCDKGYRARIGHNGNAREAKGLAGFLARLLGLKAGCPIYTNRSCSETGLPAPAHIYYCNLVFRSLIYISIATFFLNAC